MAADVAVSLSVLALVILLSDVTRRLLVRGLVNTGLSPYAVELVSTFQLCCCTQELKLLSESGGIPPQLALTLTYVTSVAHGLTFRGAVGNPCGALEHAYRGRLSGGCAVRRIACHAIHASLPQAAAVELMCAFAVQTVITHTQSVEEKFRVHAVAAAITTAVYAAGGVTGAVFNPALAFSTQFPCSGNSFLEYCFVYWLGPLLGMMSSVLLFDKLTTAFSQKSSPLHLPLRTKKQA
ncbi:hypothetical protein CCH79_00018207 [Gambusia affinis]|uniref:Aquaporin n=1 Tax=Gambusia affinis TaxID=33528 RepID=A0A315VGH4_GAMAF|nr:hypothetical protein CCH79_00018207 [Gambusia affinis]